MGALAGDIGGSGGKRVNLPSTSPCLSLFFLFVQLFEKVTQKSLTNIHHCSMTKPFCSQTVQIIWQNKLAPTDTGDSAMEKKSHKALAIQWLFLQGKRLSGKPNQTYLTLLQFSHCKGYLHQSNMIDNICFWNISRGTQRSHFTQPCSWPRKSIVCVWHCGNHKPVAPPTKKHRDSVEPKAAADLPCFPPRFQLNMSSALSSPLTAARAKLAMSL